MLLSIITVQEYSSVDYVLAEKPFYMNSKAIALPASFCTLDCSVGGNSYLR